MKIPGKPLERVKDSERVPIVEFFLPWAPSTNHVWQVGKRDGRASVYRSQKYDTFLNDVRALAFLGKIPAIERAPSYKVVLSCYPPNARKYDIDNRIKATLDALTRIGFWEDDALVNEVTAKKCQIKKGGLMKISVESDFRWSCDQKE